MTLVNHDPGPKTSQSAEWTASTAWLHALGAGGTSRTSSTTPRLTATAC